MVQHLNPESRKQGVFVRKFGWLGASYQLTGDHFEISTIEGDEKSAPEHFGSLLADGWVYRPLDAPRGTTSTTATPDSGASSRAYAEPPRCREPEGW